MFNNVMETKTTKSASAGKKREKMVSFIPITDTVIVI